MTNERAAFEAWAASQGAFLERKPAPYTNSEDRNGNYFDPRTQAQWEAWEARSEQDRAAAEPSGEQSNCPSCKAPFFVAENGCQCCGHK